MADKLPKPKSKKSATTPQPEPDIKSAKPTAQAQPPAPNSMSEKQMREFVIKAIKQEKRLVETRARCNAEIASERALLGAIEKDFKKQGGNLDALKQLIEHSKRDPEELAREVREINRLAKLAGIPIGYQLGLFEDGRSVATAIEDDAGDPLKKLEAEGYVAGKAGKTMSTCGHAEETPEHDAFLKGWKRATGENAGVGSTPRKPRNGAAAGATAH